MSTVVRARNHDLGGHFPRQARRALKTTLQRAKNKHVGLVHGAEQERGPKKARKRSSESAGPWQHRSTLLLLRGGFSAYSVILHSLVLEEKEYRM